MRSNHEIDFATATYYKESSTLLYLDGTMIQVAGHGFDLSESLKVHCQNETQEKLAHLALSQFSANWMLKIEREEQMAHLNWNDGMFHGDVTVSTTDMHQSIHSCIKKAVEQMKKAHEKKQNHHPR